MKYSYYTSHNRDQKDTLDNQRKESEKLACQICGKPFPKESTLHQHMKTVHGEKPWQCSICFKTFTTKYFLRKHKRIHTGETPYECSICHKVFTFQQSYHKHMLYHTDDKPYCCSHCGRLFKELSTLNNHERIHSGEKPFACETCGKSFRQRVSYLVHRRIHTGAMPYKCTACNKSFRYKISQRTHKCPEQPPGVVVKTQVSLVDRLQAVISKEGKLHLQSSAENEPPTDVIEMEPSSFIYQTDQRDTCSTADSSHYNEMEFEGTTTKPLEARTLSNLGSEKVICDNIGTSSNSSSPNHDLNFNEMLFGCESSVGTSQNSDSAQSKLDSSPSESLGRLHISSTDIYSQQYSSNYNISTPPINQHDLSLENMEDMDLCCLLFDVS